MTPPMTPAGLLKKSAVSEHFLLVKLLASLTLIILSLLQSLMVAKQHSLLSASVAWEPE